MCRIVDTTEDRPYVRQVTLLRNNVRYDIIEEGGLSNRSAARGEQSESHPEGGGGMGSESKMMWTRAYVQVLQQDQIVKIEYKGITCQETIQQYNYSHEISRLYLLGSSANTVRKHIVASIYDCSRKESQTTNVATPLI
nr:hypothetical protein Iba_chr13aCG0030 [Ipomoea batatas]GMD79079.1 hypothetical protein Iba_chr13dCG0350 [Ipomoea batatas]